MELRKTGVRAAETAALLLLAGNAYLDSEGRGYGRTGHRFGPLDFLRSPASAWICPRCGRRSSRTCSDGDQPFLVVGNAGAVGTGAVDPLAELAALCREYGLWFHVDGAYGGLAAGVPGAPEELRGLALADSVAVDPHKWLYAPLEAGCILVRDPRLPAEHVFVSAAVLQLRHRGRSITSISGRRIRAGSGR